MTVRKGMICKRCRKGKFTRGEMPRLFVLPAGGGQSEEMFVVMNFPTLICNFCGKTEFVESSKIRTEIGKIFLGETSKKIKPVEKLTLDGYRIEPGIWHLT